MLQGVHLGLAAENISVYGLPLRQMFWNVDTSTERRAAVREGLGLACAQPVVLLIGGGDGMGKLSETAMSFIQLLSAASDGLPAAEAMQVGLLTYADIC